MIKRSLLIFLVYLFLLSVNIYAEDNNTSMVEKSISTDFINSQIVYKLEDESNGVNESINIYDYEDCYCVSLREIIELLGGDISWNYNKNTQQLGTINIYGKQYDYYSHLALDSYTNNSKEESFPITFYLVDNNIAYCIPLSSYAESLFANYIDGKIYIPVSSLRDLFPRIGYLVGLDTTEKIIYFKEYDSEIEKKKIMTKFPVEQYGNNFYSQDDKEPFELFHDYLPYEHTYYSNISYDKQAAMTKQILVNCNKMFGISLTHYNDIKNDEFYKYIFKACYQINDDINIFINYDSDIEAYVIANFDYITQKKINSDCKLIIVRKIDDMILLMI